MEATGSVTYKVTLNFISTPLDYHVSYRKWSTTPIMLLKNVA